MYDIKLAALAAAQTHAHSVDDLLVQAARIEAYLNDQYSNDGLLIESNPPIIGFGDQESNVVVDDDASDIIALAKSLTDDLEELGYTQPKTWASIRRNKEVSMIEKDKAKMKYQADLIENCVDIGTAPIDIDIETFDPISFSMDNYKLIDNCGLRQPLNHLLIHLASFFPKESVVLNVCRQLGTTMMLSAFARQESALGRKILFLSPNFRNAQLVSERIDDNAVNIMTFADLAKHAHAGEWYDYILIDQAAHIPYAMEEHLEQYITKCSDTYLNVKGHLSKFPYMRKIITSSPGKKRGFFFLKWACNNSYRKIAIDWTHSRISNEEAMNLKAQIGSDTFANQYENQFRPLTDEDLEGY